MPSRILKTARLIAQGQNVVALTGAGVSVESGIPPFRGKDGVWEKFDPVEYAHIDAFIENPEKVWREFLALLKNTLDPATPNAAHRGLARLEALGVLDTIITQNVDGLHQMAGNTDVIEFHGTFAAYRCMECGARRTSRRIDTSCILPRCACGGIFRPECVFFGEPIPTQLLRRSEQTATECDIMLVIGTSAVVQPAALMPVLAKESGARIIEINTERTPLTGQVSDLFIEGLAGDVISRLVEAVEQQMPGP
jgi:NAD-dependent protein deacetylase/lipoamidase